MTDATATKKPAAKKPADKKSAAPKAAAKAAPKKAAAPKAASGATGRISQVIGAVVDVEFDGALPAILNALETENTDQKTGQVDVVTLAFSRYKSVVVQTPTLTQLIPAQIEGAAATIDLKGAAYEYEPDEEAILETLLPRNLTVQVLSALLENQAGFYAAQMAAMDNATRNAGDMIAALNLKKNRTRQAQITKELIEIISGAEAL